MSVLSLVAPTTFLSPPNGWRVDRIFAAGPNHSLTFCVALTRRGDEEPIIGKGPTIVRAYKRAVEMIDETE